MTNINWKLHILERLLVFFLGTIIGFLSAVIFRFNDIFNNIMDEISVTFIVAAVGYAVARFMKIFPKNVRERFEIPLGGIIFGFVIYLIFFRIIDYHTTLEIRTVSVSPTIGTRAESIPQTSEGAVTVVPETLSQQRTTPAPTSAELGAWSATRAHEQETARAVAETRSVEQEQTREVTQSGAKATLEANTIVLSPSHFSAATEGCLTAPGNGYQDYTIVLIDTRAFPNGGKLVMTVGLGSGGSDGSFDLFLEGTDIPTKGKPDRSVAHIWDLGREHNATMEYRFSAGQVFQFGATGNWMSPKGTTNTFSLSVAVEE
jgi:hypothetical protein